MPYTESLPQLVPVISELVTFTAKQFEAGEVIERKLEEALQDVQKTIAENKQKAEQQAQQEAQAQQAQQQPQQAPPPPDTSAQELQLKAAELQQRGQIEAQKIQSNERIAAADMQQKREIETAKIQADLVKHRDSELNKLTASQLKSEADARKQRMML